MTSGLRGAIGDTPGPLPAAIPQGAPFTSNGNPFDMAPGKVGELRDSSASLGDTRLLRDRMAEDGYLLLRGYLDRERVLDARREILTKFDVEMGLIDRSRPLMEGVYSGDSSRLVSVNRSLMARTLRSGPAVRGLCLSGRMIDLYERFLGGEVLPLNFIWIRNQRVGSATGCHFDWVYMGRGTKRLYTSWTPLGRVRLCDGPLAVLEGSHRFEPLKETYGALDVDRDKGRRDNPYGDGILTRDPGEPQRRYGGRWLTAEFEPGDLLLFGMFTLHCSLDNTNPENRIRLSTDTRYQLASEPADERWIGEEPFGHGMM